MANSLQQANEPTLASLLALHKEDVMWSINCHQVGEIVSFDPSTQTAEVQIKMLRMMNGELKEYPVLIDCPCIILAGGEGRLTFPISAGDSCLVLFNDKDIDNWYAGGQTMPPNTERLHDFADAIALVGVRNMQNKISDYLADGTELKYGNSSIKLKDGYIDIKGNVNIVQNEVDDNSLHAYVISSYHSGTDWYRVWSDGWCEQGGSATVGSGASTPVTLQKPYKDLNYGLFITSNSAWYGKPQANNTALKTSISQITIWNGSHITSEFSWETKGYIK